MWILLKLNNRLGVASYQSALHSHMNLLILYVKRNTLFNHEGNIFCWLLSHVPKSSKDIAQRQNHNEQRVVIRFLFSYLQY